MILISILLFGSGEVLYPFNALTFSNSDRFWRTFVSEICCHKPSGCNFKMISWNSRWLLSDIQWYIPKKGANNYRLMPIFSWLHAGNLFIFESIVCFRTKKKNTHRLKRSVVLPCLGGGNEHTEGIGSFQRSSERVAAGRQDHAGPGRGRLGRRGNVRRALAGRDRRHRLVVFCADRGAQPAGRSITAPLLVLSRVS